MKLILHLVLHLASMVSSNSPSCPQDMLAVYSLSLRTEWSEDKFPKQYPQWRPPAQWSKTIGYVHAVDSPLYSIGSTVSDGVRQFVETGVTDKLELETASKTFLDAVLAPPIPAGVGLTNTTIFVDTNHTKPWTLNVGLNGVISSHCCPATGDAKKISVMTKLVPSPDWFVGLDSLELCSQGAFVESVITEASPLDGGTDNGFTFTSPNWATQPQDSVFAITSTYPTHPAGSFNYPHLTRLPTIAVYSLTKLREYSLEQNYEATTSANGPATEQMQEKSREEKKFRYDIFDEATNTAKNAVGKNDDVIEFVPVKKESKKVNDYEIISNDITPEAISSPNYSVMKKKINLLGSSPSKGFRSQTSITGYHASTSPENFFKKKYSSEHLNKVQEKVFPTKLSTMSKTDLYKQIMSAYLGGNTKKIRRKKKRLRKKKHSRHHKKPRDCHVSEWSSWGPCSKTCGIGETLRTRVIKQHPAHGGRHCPPLRDYKWCGSARNCNKGYFGW